MEVTTRSNDIFSAASVISAIPLHCLGDIDFTPPLVKAIVNTRHPNLGGKVHVHSSNTVQPWFGISDKYDSVCAGLTESESTVNGTNLVTFVYSDSLGFLNLERVHRTKSLLLSRRSSPKTATSNRPILYGMIEQLTNFQKVTGHITVTDNSPGDTAWVK